MDTFAVEHRTDDHTLAGLIRRYAGSLLGVVVATLAGLSVAQRWGTDPVVLLFIPPVLAAAVYAGLWPALVAAVASTLSYNYYFTAPYHTLRVDRASDVVTVVILFLVAVVTSQLAARLRDQARLAASHATRNGTIAGFARRLLSCADEQHIAMVTVDELARLFDCNAVLMTGAEAPAAIASAPGPALLAPSDVAAAAVALDTGEPTGRGVQRLHLADWQFHPIASDSAVMATLGVARDDGSMPVAEEQRALLASLLDQVALALERVRVESEARELAALRDRDKLRSALLDTIGVDLKPRLNAISAAARALRRAGSADKATVTEIATEATQLDRYVDNLVDLSIGSDPGPLAFGPVTLDLRRRTVVKDGVAVHLTPKEYALLAELAKNAGSVLTHTHLLRAVWGPAQSDHIDYLRVAIRALRQKLEADPADPNLIVNEPAIGYRLVPR